MSFSSNIWRRNQVHISLSNKINIYELVSKLYIKSNWYKFNFYLKDQKRMNFQDEHLVKIDYDILLTNEPFLRCFLAKVDLDLLTIKY